VPLTLLVIMTTLVQQLLTFMLEKTSTVFGLLDLFGHLLAQSKYAHFVHLLRLATGAQLAVRLSL
jgi:hypothetical protein